MQLVTVYLTMPGRERETTNELGVVLQGQLELRRSKGFVPVHIHTDLQSSFRSLTTSFEHVVIDVVEQVTSY